MHVHQSLFRGKTERHVQRVRPGSPQRHRQGLHRRAAQAHARVHVDPQPVREQLQAPGPRLRGPRVHQLGAPQPHRASSACRSTSRARRAPCAPRSATPTRRANPYLAFAVMLAAGLEGIEKGYELPPSVEPNIYKMTADERETHGLGDLPTTSSRRSRTRRRASWCAARPWRPRVRALRDQQAQRVVRVPRAGHGLGSPQVLLQDLSSTRDIEWTPDGAGACGLRPRPSFWTGARATARTPGRLNSNRFSPIR